MKAEELRIGNWVECDGSEFQIKTIDQSGCYVKNSEEETWIELFQLNPIALSEDKLRQFGFDDDEYKEGYIGLAVKSKNMTTDFVLTKPFHLGDWQEAYQFEWNNFRITSIKYVHHLQNLLHSLSSQELTITQTEEANDKRRI